ncbi:hypothetical protein ULMS_00420 [Patiriisocius marinistellae]|uniref:Uncharacterized protein n=1 Tax=Patiriisocius marinistellae TaxID=2494560 RepID=A0A5J4FU58_9FLAO|nr:hypothetical protein [Patiriisocius marinistellae]GEQ84534.1 hypothetical protein ULMS_00420 [Patiriisocius marinistellae]
MEKPNYKDTQSKHPIPHAEGLGDKGKPNSKENRKEPIKGQNEEE